MTPHDWVSIRLEHDFVSFRKDQNVIHPDGFFSRMKPSILHWLWDQDLHAEWKYVLDPTLNSEEALDHVWIGPRWFAEEWLSTQSLSEADIVAVQRPCPCCKQMFYADDGDSVYPCNRERTKYQAGCTEHNFGCGYHVYGIAYNHVIEKWNMGSMSESDQLPIYLQETTFDLEFEHSKMLEFSKKLQTSKDEWIRLLNLQLIQRNDLWHWSGFCMRPSQLNYHGMRWLATLLFT